jgi:hypothetical protein
MIFGNTHLKRTLMIGAFAVAGALAFAPATALARNSSSMNEPRATVGSSAGASGSDSAQGKSDADDMTHSSTNVTGNTISQSNADADDTMRPEDQDAKSRGDVDAKTDSDARTVHTRTARTSAGRIGNRTDADDNAPRSARSLNSNGRFAADRDRGLDRAEDRMSDRGFIHRASFRHHRHHYHVAFRDRDDARMMNDDTRARNDRDDMNSPSGH